MPVVRNPLRSNLPNEDQSGQRNLSGLAYSGYACTVGSLMEQELRLASADYKGQRSVEFLGLRIDGMRVWKGMPKSVVGFNSIVNRRIAAIPARVGRWLLFWFRFDPALQAFMDGRIALGRALKALYTPCG